MLDRIWSTLIIECDQCGNTEEAEIDDCLDSFKSDGWINRKVDDEWHNFCCEEHYQKFKAEKDFK